MKVYKNGTGADDFVKELSEQNILIVSDVNTSPFGKALKGKLAASGKRTEEVCFPDKHLVPEIERLAPLIEQAKSFEYILGVGSGVINDLCKYVAFTDQMPYGIFATAPSMDGYVSGVSAMYEHGKKVTLSTTIPREVILDTDVLKNAPLDMIEAGAGDLIGKYTSLLDWKLSHLLFGEAYDVEIVRRMREAVAKCMAHAEKLPVRDDCAVEALADGLVLSGIEMQNAGSSRPASGSEHHISHYLEMAGERAGKDFAPHGVKVALGCLASVFLYRYCLQQNLKELLPVKADVEALPTVEALQKLYGTLGLPTRFSQIGVDRALLIETVENAYTVRERFTILRLLAQKGMLHEVAPLVAETFA